MENLFYSIQYKNGCLAASDLFHMFTHNQLSSLHSVTRIKQYRCLKDVIHQIDSKNEWLLLSFSIGKHFFLEFSF